MQGDPKRATNGSTKLPSGDSGTFADHFPGHFRFQGRTRLKNDMEPERMDLEDEEENEHDVPDFVGEDELYQ